MGEDDEWKKRGALLILILAAALLAAILGIAGAHRRLAAEPFPLTYSSGCSHLSESAKKYATVTEILDVHSKAQPVTYSVTEIVTVSADNPYARALIRHPGSAAARQAYACLFSVSVDSLPRFTSAADRMVTFSDSGQFSVPVNEWQSAVHPSGTQIGFDPQPVCGSYPMGNWAGTTLTLTVRSDEALGPVTPVPDSLDGTTYSWHSPAGSCDRIPRISVRVPESLAGALSSAIFGPGPLATSVLPQILGWSDPILTGLIALWLALRIPRKVPKRSASLALVIVALLGIAPAAIDLSLSQDALRGPAELVAVYGVSLGLLLILLLRTSQETEAAGEGADHRPSPGVSRRAGLALTAAACAGTAVLLACAYRYPVWFPGAGYLLTAAAAVLLVAAGAVVCRLATAGQVADEPRLPIPAWADIGKVRNSLVFWVGAALLVAVAYSMGHVVDFGAGEPVTLAEYSVLRYPLATFAEVLIPVALVIPLAYQGSPARKIVAAAAFGFSMAASQPDVVVGRWAIPLGTVLLSVLVYAVVRKDDEPVEQPSGGPAADTVLAVKIAAPLALIPVGYFIYTTAAHLPATVQDPGPDTVFVVVSFLGQLTGWLIIGIFYGLLSSRLPGRIGPVRALVLAGAWFAVAIAVNIVNNVLHYPVNRGWIFAGLQFTFFLLAFSVVWDACALKEKTLKETVDKLRAAYHVQETRAIALYAIPLVLAVVALVQQVASGSSADFVTGILNGAAAAFGGKG